MFYLLLLLFSFELSAKVRILTFHFNEPQLIDVQQRAFQRFFLDEYETIVINDADNESNEEEIRLACEKWGIECVRYEQSWHRTDPLNEQIRDWMKQSPQTEIFLADCKEKLFRHPSVRHSHLIQWALDRFGYDHDDAIVILDADCFPIRPVSVRELLKEVDFIGIEGIRAPFIAFFPSKLPDVRQLHFNVSLVGDRFWDVGGHCKHYLREHPTLIFKEYPQRNSHEYARFSIEEMKALGFTEAEAEIAKAVPPKFYLEFQIDNHFIHLGASSNNLLGIKIKLKHVLSWLAI